MFYPHLRGGQLPRESACFWLNFLNGAPVSYGYRTIFKDINGVKKRVIELTKNEAPVVKRAFDLFLQVEGAKQIAQ